MGNQYKLINTTNLSSKSDLVTESKFDQLEQDFSEDELELGNSVKVSEEDGSEEDDSQDVDYELSLDEEGEDEISEELIQSQDVDHELSHDEEGECNKTEVFSEYDNSDDEVDDATVVHGRTDFRRFKWIVGQVFGIPVEFKEVMKYAVH